MTNWEIWVELCGVLGRTTRRDAAALCGGSPDARNLWGDRRDRPVEHSVHGWLDNAFTWLATPEGTGYWLALAKAMDAAGADAAGLSRDELLAAMRTAVREFKAGRL